MTQDTHEEARQVIALARAAELSDGEQKWLQAHLDSCESCRDYADATRQVIAALRSVPVTADARLVRAAQMRVRFHASRLREARERMWLVGMACFLVGLSATLTAPLLWHLFAWVAERTGIPGPVWETTFVLFYIAPALAVSLLFMASGTHLAGEGERSRRS
jgi:predicted anti-sigma-YlaC factor YlaD